MKNEFADLRPVDVDDSWLPIHYAAVKGDIADMRDIIFNVYRPFGGTPSSPLSDGRRPLHIAAFEGQTEAVKQLVYWDAPVNARDDEGWTAYLISMSIGDKETADFLKSCGGDGFTQIQLNGTWFTDEELYKINRDACAEDE